MQAESGAVSGYKHPAQVPAMAQKQGKTMYTLPTRVGCCLAVNVCAPLCAQTAAHFSCESIWQLVWQQHCRVQQDWQHYVWVENACLRFTCKPEHSMSHSRLAGSLPPASAMKSKPPHITVANRCSSMTSCSQRRCTMSTMHACNACTTIASLSYFYTWQTLIRHVSNTCPGTASMQCSDKLHIIDTDAILGAIP